MSATVSALVALVDGRRWQHVEAGGRLEGFHADISWGERDALLLASLGDLSHPADAECVQVGEATVTVSRWAGLYRESEAWQAVAHALEVREHGAPADHHPEAVAA